jgi:gas vesicle protein
MTRHSDEDELVYVRDDGGSGVKWFVAGAALGGIAALLLAPHSGKKTRKLIRRMARDLRDMADEGLDELGDRFGEGKERVREEAGRVREAIHDRVEDVRGRANDTAKAVRGAGATAREELERRLADARRSRRAAAVADDEEPVI